MDFTFSTATDLAAAMAAGEVSATELAQAAIARIETLDTRINAICVRDFDRAMMAARAADDARAKGDVRPLLGIPMTVKESFNVTGLPTTWGMPPFKDFRPPEDAVAVARVKAAGAVILGKTNVPFALGDWQSYNDIYGATANPWDLGRTPGGSSGGSSAALAAGYGALSLGSDIAGSLRAPAHFCGIYAHKPSFGLVTLRGHLPPPLPALPFERDFSAIGPMARCAGDLSLLLELLAVPDEEGLGIAYKLALPPPRHAAFGGFRALVLDNHPLLPTAAGLRGAIDSLAKNLAGAGVTVARESSLLPDLMAGAKLFVRLLLSVFSLGWPAEDYEQTRAKAATLAADDTSLAAESARGAVMSHREWLLAAGARTRIRQNWHELFRAFDVVICPIMPTPAFPTDHSAMNGRRLVIDGESHDYGDQLVWPAVATLPGLPATAVPIGLSEGLPIGVQIIGPMFEDRTPLRFAELIEREFGGFVPPPAFA